MNTLPYHNYDLVIETDGDPDDYDEASIVKVLRTYADEAENARRSGMNPRDAIWDANWDRYWGRYGTEGKAAWQSTHVMPEAPAMVDRWAASMREALDGGQGVFYTVVDAAGKTSRLSTHITKTMRALLSKCARTQDGHVMSFSSLFEEQMKLGSLMACCASVTWDDDLTEGGWVRIDTVDPREYWGDAKGRNLYRKRQYEIDHYELMAMARQSDDDGESLYDTDAIMDLMADEDERMRLNKERSSGSGYGEAEVTGRKPIKLEEFLATIIMPNGDTIADKNLVVVANDRHIIRGPEPNPFWHERDWIVFAPMVSVPLSLYGRTYMEDWADVADAFVELTNLILDGVFVGTIRAFVANPDLLENPNDLIEGITPNKVYITSEEIDDVRRFISQIDMGTLPQDAYQIWTALKQELQEGAKLSEIALGQMAPNSRTTATEIQQVQQSGSAMIRSMARNLEDHFLEPLLNLVWKTALQHMDFMLIADQIGEETAMMLDAQREEFADSGIHFQVRGLSGLIDRQSKLQNVLSVIQVIGSNEALLQQFLQQISVQQLLEQIFTLFGLDIDELKPTERELVEQRLTQMQQQLPPGQGGGQPQGGQPQGGQPQAGGQPAPANNQDLVA